MMLKIIIYILIGYFFIRLINKFAKKNFTGLRQNSKRPSRVKTEAEIAKLIACPKCGTFFQQAQGVEKLGFLYCSEKCVAHK